MKKNNDGKDFEKLAYLINKSLHKTAIVTFNDKLIDHHTKRKRQIDISIRFKDGPTELMVIVEARDRSRPVDVNYIEQVHSKINSVSANAAIIISNKGFYKTAIEKANKLGIKTFTLEEALKNDWSITFKNFNFFIYSKIKCDNVLIYFLDKLTNKIINPSSETLETIKAGDHKKLIFYDINHNPYKSFLDLFNYGFANIQKEVNSDPQKQELIKLNIPQKLNFFISINSPEKVYFLNENNEFKEINFILFEGNFWREEKKYEPVLSKYESTSKNLIAEALTFKEDEEFKLNFVSDKISGTTSLYLTFNGNKK